LRFKALCASRLILAAADDDADDDGRAALV